MAAGTLISVAEYLSTSYDPDCDYVDGVLIERNVGETDHSSVQGLLVAYLVIRRKQWNIHVFPEQRVQVKPTRFRVPDVCVVAGAKPQERILTSPPLVCIEILSREDRWSQVQEKIDDYLSFGVRYVWVIDPRSRKAYEFTTSGMHEVRELRTQDDPEVIVPLEALFE
jgi:Uma2 family endonuclease